MSYLHYIKGRVPLILFLKLNYITNNIKFLDNMKD